MAQIMFSPNELSVLKSSTFVPPSGGDDYDAIQGTIDLLQKTTPLYQHMAPVFLSGTYRISKGLRFGNIKANDTDYAALSRVVLHGLGQAKIILTEPTDYMIRMYGAVSTGGSKSILSNLLLDAQGMGRGVLAATTATQSSIDNVCIRGTIETALDLIGDWCCNLRSVLVERFQGFGIRGRNINACHWDSVFFGSGVAIVTLDPWKVPHAQLCEYANVNGIDAALAHFPPGTVALAKWPSADDTSCTDSSGVVFATTDSQRSALMLQQGNGSTWTNLGFESCGFIEYPLIYSERPVRQIFQTIRTEKCWNRNERVLLRDAKHCRFDSVATEDGPASAGPSTCKCFLRLAGQTQGNRVSYLTGTAGLTDHIVIHDTGSHEGNVCECCATEGRYIPTSRWIGEVGDARVSPCWNDRYVG